MLLKPLTLVAGLLAFPAARAFLVPPEVSDADIKVANTIESVSSPATDIQVVDVKCPGCPVLLTNRRGKSVQFKTRFPSHLELAFSIDHLADHDRLMLNGVELYPSHETLITALKAPQIVDRKSKEKRHHPDGERHRGRHRVYPQPQQLSFGLKVSPPMKDAEGQFELVDIEFQIFAVGVAFIDGIPAVKVKLIKDGEGRLLISQIEKGEGNTFVKELPGGDAKECTTMLCRWLAAAREKLKKFKGFGHCSTKGGENSPASGKPSYSHSHPHSDRPVSGHRHGHGHHEHRWGKLLKHMASHILLPVLIGIVAGVTVSLIGMAVGTVLISFWRLFFRRRSTSSGHRRRHSHHKAPRKEVVLVEEEKAGLMENQDAPPSYEEHETPKAQV